jgi:diguanylate cyclase (GGDEF)-like protein
VINVHDTLNTIPNRFAFIDSVEQSALTHSNMALMLIDVVRFSDVTTSFGIKVGDVFLLEIANRILSIFKDKVHIGRISGDVFGLIIPGQFTLDQLQAKYEFLVEHFKSPMYHEGHAFIADFNVGIVLKDKHSFDIIEFVSKAEAALKIAKENKYENCFILSADDKADTGRSLALKADLKRALAREELELYFQPQVDLNTLKIVSAECLLRWNHPIDGVLFPGPLIEAAESYNMMNELAYWTLEQAFKSMLLFDAQGINISLSVNISPTQLYDTKLIPALIKLSQKYELALSRFELELTEDVALSNSLMVKKQLSQIRALGVKIAVDDFGKGYSNLAYIRELTIDTLKIDKTFVMELSPTNLINQAIIEATQLIGKAKGCEVIAEGVETLEQLHFLRESNIQTGQGYLFSPAVPHYAFIELAQQEIIVGGTLHRKSLA